MRTRDAVVAEGDAGSQVANAVVYLVDAAGDPYSATETVTVDFATGDIAVNPLVAHPGSDFVPSSGTLTFEVGESVTYTPIEILGDTIDEPPLLYGEWGLVQFSNPVNTTVTGGLYGLGVFIIIDDD